MKSRLNVSVVLGVIFLILAGCVTGSGGGSSQDFMVPDQLIGRNITGNNDNEQLISMKLSTDNTLLYIEDGKTYSGTWEYDNTKDLLAYTLTWDIESSPQGYLATITGSGEDVTIMGYWFISDMNKSFYLSGKMTE